MSGEHKDFDLDQLAFYSLDELEQIYQLESGEIIRDATLGNIKLCIHVPKDFHVCSVDISSIDQGYSENFKRRFKRGYINPDEAEDPQPIREGEVAALVVERLVLVDINRNWPNTGQVFFNEAYILSRGNGRIRSNRWPTLSKPIRWYPLGALSSHVVSNSYPSRARFVLYPSGTQLKFTENVGYTTPFRRLINKKDLLVLGEEFKVYTEKKAQQYLQENVENQQLDDDDPPVEPLVEKAQGADGESNNVDATAVDVSLEGPNKTGKKKVRNNLIRLYIRDAIEALVNQDTDPTPIEVMKYLRSIFELENSGTGKNDMSSLRWKTKSGKQTTMTMERLEEKLAYLRREEPHIFTKNHISD
ncbi:MAG: hypothetical protein Q7U16_10465 [Agitococcus sp.]|nr:hypothetical protein [Agitococcus sp.]